MVTKLTNSAKVNRDMAFGQRLMLVSTPDQDVKENKDYVLGEFGIAWRRRRISLKKYGQISIRYSRENGARTEFSKLLNGETKAQLYIFEFTNCYVICKVSDIIQLLKQHVYQIVDNHDGEGTKAAYIATKDIHHLVIERSNPALHQNREPASKTA